MRKAFTISIDVYVWRTSVREELAFNLHVREKVFKIGRLTSRVGREKTWVGWDVNEASLPYFIKVRYDFSRGCSRIWFMHLLCKQGYGSSSLLSSRSTKNRYLHDGVDWVMLKSIQNISVCSSVGMSNCFTRSRPQVRALYSRPIKLGKFCWLILNKLYN